MCSRCGGNGKNLAWSPATRCRPIVATRNRTRLGSTTLTVTSGKCSWCWKTTCLRDRAHKKLLAAPPAVAHPHRSTPMSKARVLFLCTGNSARSQMAEGYLRHVAGNEFEPLSAGIEPKGLNPLAVEAMQEIGIDISRQASKDVRELLGQAIPYVITVCDNAKARCPIFPRTYKFLHWSLEDPAETPGSHDEKLAVFRQVRDEIAQRIQQELLTPANKQ